MTGLALLLLVQTVSAASNREAFAAKLGSSDIVYSHRALDGAPVLLFERPREYAAGVSVPAGVAKVYGGQFSNNDSGNNDSNISNNNDHGNPHDGDHNDDGHNDNGRGNDNNKGNPRIPVDNELIKNHEFTHDLSDWDSRSAYVTSSFGPIRASALSNDGVFAAVHTGYSGSNNLGFLEQSIPVPMARNAILSALYNFVTTEFPVWQGSGYNDYFQVTLTGPSGEKTFKMAEFLNSSTFEAVSGLPEGVVDGWFPGATPVTGGQTGWRMFNQGALALKNGIYKLRIEVRDVGDNIVDSAILVDRVSLR